MSQSNILNVSEIVQIFPLGIVSRLDGRETHTTGLAFKHKYNINVNVSIQEANDRGPSVNNNSELETGLLIPLPMLWLPF